jgi:hypothetical protein
MLPEVLDCQVKQWLEQLCPAIVQFKGFQIKSKKYKAGFKSKPFIG